MFGGTTYYDNSPYSPLHSSRQESFSSTVESSSYVLEPLCGATGPSSHAGCNRSKESKLRVWLYALAPLMLHFLLTVVVVVFTLLYIDNGEFNLTMRKPYITEVDGSLHQDTHYTPLQSDITTILSLTLSIVRTFVSAWCGATCWRCAFILMEKTGMDIHHLSTMLSFGIPSMFRSHRPEGGGTGTVLLVALILIMMLPLQFAAPILTGSITWSPAYSHVPSSTPLTNISISVNGYPWTWYQRYRPQRSSLVLQAAGAASVAWGGLAGPAVSKRVIPSTLHLPVNSTLVNVTLPYFTVGSLEWISDPAGTLTDAQIQTIRPGSDLLNISSEDNPIQVVAPNVALIPSQPWLPLSDGNGGFDFPKPTMVSSASGVVVVFANRQNTGIPCGWNTSTDTFGILPVNIGFVPIMFNNNQTNCYIFAKVTYSAGVGTCMNCRLSSSTVVQTDHAITLEADSMTVDAIAMMPEVISAMVLTGSSVLPTLNNLDNYTISALFRSYGASWTALTNLVGSQGPHLSTQVAIAVPVSQARVAHWRLYLWLLLNLLLTLSGLLFILLQIRCVKLLVATPAIAAMFFDNEDILRKDRRGLCSLSVLAKEDNEVGTLRLRRVHNHMSLVAE